MASGTSGLRRDPVSHRSARLSSNRSARPIDVTIEREPGPVPALILSNSGNELLERSFDALATEPARDGFDEPAEQRRRASAEPERFHLDGHAVVVFGELREGARAP